MAPWWRLEKDFLNQAIQLFEQLLVLFFIQAYRFMRRKRLISDKLKLLNLLTECFWERYDVEFDTGK